jgi:hypothetical protein
MFAVLCLEFESYREERAPSLFYLDGLRHLAFRTKIYDVDYAAGFTSPRSGIDLYQDMHTKEVYGFSCMHFEGDWALKILLQQSPGPYTPLQVLVVIEKLLNERGENLGEHRNLLAKLCELATQSGCVLRCAAREVEGVFVLTRETARHLHLPSDKIMH